MIRSRKRRPGQQATDPARLGHPRRPRTWSRSCCRERASWITGGNIVVDGGQRYPSARRPPRTGGIKQRLVSGWVAFCKTRRVAGTGLPELDVARVRRWCEQRVPAHVRDQIRVECEVAPRHLTIVECRAPGRPEAGPEWTRFPIARLRYTKASGRWSLFRRDRHLRFHAYDGFAPSAHVDDLLREIDADPTAIFWG